jgi:hypothetical protein
MRMIVIESGKIMAEFVLFMYYNYNILSKKLCKKRGVLDGKDNLHRCRWNTGRL